MAKLPRKEKYRRKYANRKNKWWTEERKQEFIQKQKNWCQNMDADRLRSIASYIEETFKDEALIKSLRKTAEAIETGNDELYLETMDWELTSISYIYRDASNAVPLNPYIKEEK